MVIVNDLKPGSSFIYNLSEVYYNVFEYHFANIETSNKGDYHGIHIQ